MNTAHKVDAVVHNLGEHLLRKSGGGEGGQLALMLLGLFAAAWDRDADVAASVLAGVVRGPRTSGGIPSSFWLALDAATEEMRETVAEVLALPALQQMMARSYYVTLRTDTEGKIVFDESGRVIADAVQRVKR